MRLTSFSDYTLRVLMYLALERDRLATIPEIAAARAAEAAALADTILTEAPNNLMGYFVKAIIADFQGDKAKAEAARAEYRKQYDSEIAKKRDEYQAHLALLEAFKNAPSPK